MTTTEYHHPVTDRFGRLVGYTTTADGPTVYLPPPADLIARAARLAEDCGRPVYLIPDAEQFRRTFDPPAPSIGATYTACTPTGRTVHYGY